MKIKRTLWILLALCFAICALACTKPPEVISTAAATTEPASDTAAGGVTFTSTDLDGNEISEAYIHANKVTVVNFWATWCPPCVGEIPGFSSVAAAYASKGCAILGVQCDDDLDAARKLWSDNGVSYPSVLPDGDLTKYAESLSAIPVTILLDGSGVQIGDAHVGAMSESELSALLDEALSTR